MRLGTASNVGHALQLAFPGFLEDEAAARGELDLAGVASGSDLDAERPNRRTERPHAFAQRWLQAWDVMVPFVMAPWASGSVHDAEMNRFVRSGIVQLASNDVA